MKSIFLLGFLLFVQFQIAVAQRGIPMTTFRGKSPDEMIGEFMREHKIPGLALAIVQAPYIPRVVGYGVADVEKGLLVSPNTLWPIGEVTQAYTAVALMQLVESGKLNLDSPVGDHVDGLSKRVGAITIRQLMGHMSGIPDYTRQLDFDRAKDNAAGSILASIRNQTLDFEPGTRVVRSASNFYLLGLVIAKVSGMTYEEFVTSRQFEALGLKNTLFPSELGRIKRESVELQNNRHQLFKQERPFIDPIEPASGYTEIDGKLIPIKSSSQSALAANGAVLASATDISIWDIGLAGGTLVKRPENRRQIYSGVKLADGSPWAANCGWRFPATKGFMDITGNPPGFSIYLSRFTAEADLVCVTLCANKEGIDLTDLGRRIAGCFDPRLGPPADPAVMTCLESCFPVQTTMDRLVSYLKSEGNSIVARLSHSDAAKKANLDLRPTETLIFGNPLVGTHLMLGQQSAALDLPLRMTTWQDEQGSVWLGWRDPSSILKQHGITDHNEVVARMNAALSAAATHATSPY